MKKLSLLFFSCIFFSSISSFSQQRINGQIKEITKTHYYTFEGNATQNKLDELQQALVKLEFVTEAKVRYKVEKNAGQVIIVTKEKEVTSENQKEFSPPVIKRTIISLGFNPIEYSKGETVSK